MSDISISDQGLGEAEQGSAVVGLIMGSRSDWPTMRHSAETCTAANRFYVHDAVHDAFTEKFTARMAALKMGNGIEPDVDVGALVNASTRDKVAHFVEDAVTKGAQLKLGGQLPNGPGFFYPPTVMTGVSEDADCVHDEIFGPVAAIQRFSDQDDAIRRANATEYGLVAYVFSGDMKRAMNVCERLEYGMVGLNRGLVSDPAAPFGGVKQSGLGREGGHEGMKEFQETQYISASW